MKTIRRPGRFSKSSHFRLRKPSHHFPGGQKRFFANLSLFRTVEFKKKNGFALEPALVLFSLVLMVSVWVCASLQARSALLAASGRSDIDLAIVERAKQFAGECAWSRRCQTAAPQKIFLETIQAHDVLFKDESSRILAQYTDHGHKYKIELYYDETGIIKAEYSH